MKNKLKKVTQKQIDTAADNVTWSRADSCERIARNLVKLEFITAEQEVDTYHALLVYCAKYEFDGKTMRELSARCARNASDATRRETAQTIMYALSNSHNAAFAQKFANALQKKKAAAHKVVSIASKQAEKAAAVYTEAQLNAVVKKLIKQLQRA